MGIAVEAASSKMTVRLLNYARHVLWIDYEYNILDAARLNGREEPFELLEHIFLGVNGQ